MSTNPKPTEEQARAAVGYLASHLRIILDMHKLPRVVPHLDVLRRYFEPEELGTEAPPRPALEATREGDWAEPEAPSDDSASIGGRPSPPSPR